MHTYYVTKDVHIDFEARFWEYFNINQSYGPFHTSGPKVNLDQNIEFFRTFVSNVVSLSNYFNVLTGYIHSTSENINPSALINPEIFSAPFLTHF